MTRRELFIDSTDGVALETVAFLHRSPRQAVSILLVHPYSLLGGSMANMTGIGGRLHEHGFNAVAFNCRGVGNSTGRPTITGKAEVEDVLAMADWMHQHLQQDVVIVGSSAGAPIAGSVVPLRPFVRSYVAVGYTFGRLCSVLFGSHFQAILSCPKPKLFIMAERDGFTSPTQLSNRLRDAAGDQTRSEIVPGVGHFELEGPAFDDFISSLIKDFIAS